MRLQFKFKHLTLAIVKNVVGLYYKVLPKQYVKVN